MGQVLHGSNHRALLPIRPISPWDYTSMLKLHDPVVYDLKQPIIDEQENKEATNTKSRRVQLRQLRLERT